MTVKDLMLRWYEAQNGDLVIVLRGSLNLDLRIPKPVYLAVKPDSRSENKISLLAQDVSSIIRLFVDLWGQYSKERVDRLKKTVETLNYVSKKIPLPKISDSYFDLVERISRLKRKTGEKIAERLKTLIYRMARDGNRFVAGYFNDGGISIGAIEDKAVVNTLAFELEYRGREKVSTVLNYLEPFLIRELHRTVDDNTVMCEAVRDMEDFVLRKMANPVTVEIYRHDVRDLLEGLGKPDAIQWNHGIWGKYVFETRGWITAAVSITSNTRQNFRMITYSRMHYADINFLIEDGEKVPQTIHDLLLHVTSQNKPQFLPVALCRELLSISKEVVIIDHIWDGMEETEKMYRYSRKGRKWEDLSGNKLSKKELIREISKRRGEW